jgi:hypothetical protein
MSWVGSLTVAYSSEKRCKRSPIKIRRICLCPNASHRVREFFSFVCPMNSRHPGFDIDPRLWALVLLLPNARHRIVGRFRNRQDADDQLRAMKRLLPQHRFEVVFLSQDSEPG